VDKSAASSLLPAWAVEQLGVPAKVTALAIDVEPVVFWDGHDPDPEALVARWKTTVGFVEGDAEGTHGRATPAMNGTSGVAVTDRILTPLGVEPTRDVLHRPDPPVLRQAGRRPGNPQQADRIEDTYGPFAKAAGLPPASLRDRPTPHRLVELAVSQEAARLRGELAGAGADLVFTLGQEARRAIALLADEANGPPTGQLQRDDSYGQPGSYASATTGHAG
jgi:hypothetical protein